MLQTFSAPEWIENIRISQQTFNHLCQRLHSVIKKESTTLHNPLPVEKHVAVTLWYLVISLQFRNIGHLLGIAHCTACVIVHETCTAIVQVLLRSHVSFPTGDKVKEVVDGFARSWGVS